MGQLKRENHDLLKELVDVQKEHRREKQHEKSQHLRETLRLRNEITGLKEEIQKLQNANAILKKKNKKVDVPAKDVFGCYPGSDSDHVSYRYNSDGDIRR